jgi:hypothetical protein
MHVEIEHNDLSPGEYKVMANIHIVQDTRIYIMIDSVPSDDNNI